ncbi:hypothetical protein ACFXEL_35165 [Streptomyces sp. NPDC059382]|uniref:hypothetical protein n=1 Tax=Streptomyces sp. NPDC059382 TaxID=3346816 RepID=UPI00369D4B79
MSVTLSVSGTLHAALQMCHPGVLPGWLDAATPRCATMNAPLQLDENQAAELADLIASAWWECEQAEGDSLPLTAAFSAACQEALAMLETPAG